MTEQWIDVHCHAITESYREAWTAAPPNLRDGMPALPPWSTQDTAELLSTSDIGSAVLCVPSPGVGFGDATAAKTLARKTNDEFAELREALCGGMYGVLPLPDVDAACAEISYCVEELRVDGFVLFTNSAGDYLDSAAMTPVLAELDHRTATVLLHPCSPCGVTTSRASTPSALIEFPFDTARAVLGLALADRFRQYPGIRWIIPHAGGVLPSLIDRVQALGPLMLGNAELDIVAMLRGLYYELSGPAAPHQLAALLPYTDTEHLLYGSDFPFMPRGSLPRWRHDLATSGLLDNAARLALMRGTARKLFPHLNN